MAFKGVLLVIAAAVLLAGCVELGSLTSFMAKDCGDDMDCFEEAAGTCSPAKVTNTETNMGMTMKYTVAILGGTKEECKLNVRVNEVNIDESLKSTMPAAMLKIIEGLAGKDMTCTAGSSVVSGSKLDLSGNQENCKGSLVDALKDMSAPSAGYGMP
jgi:hypothetical protein